MISKMSRESLEALAESRRLRAETNAQLLKAEKARADEACRDRDRQFYLLLEERKKSAALTAQLAALEAPAAQPKG